MPTSWRLGLVFVMAGACGKSAPEPPPPRATPKDAAVNASADAGAAPRFRTEPSGWNVDPALVATGKTFMVVSESDLATKVGHDVLGAGGNAVDAAIATAFALAVVLPSAGNIGGGGFAVVRTGTGEANALDFREVAPAAATADMYVDANGKTTSDSIAGDRAKTRVQIEHASVSKKKSDSLVGDRAVAVPGSVAGLWALHQKYGTRPWKALVAPAIALARDGFAIDPKLHAAIERKADKLASFPATAALWLVDGKPRATGEVVKNVELATVLERISERGPDGFYAGETAAAMVDEMKRGGGLITAADLKAYRVEWRDPVRFDYRGRHMISIPLPSSGGILLAMTANMLQGVDVGALGWHSPEHLHWVVEVWRRAFAARNDLLGDPAFAKDIPIARLLSREYAAKLVATIGPSATPSKEVTGLQEGDHTTNLCVADARGMAIALTTSLRAEFGSGVTVNGFLLNSTMDDFTTKPGSPNLHGLVMGAANKIEPGKRGLSSQSPTIIEDGSGKLYMVVGAQGGPRIATGVWQTISNVIDFGLGVDAAVAAPRFHHQHLPDEVVLEDEVVTRAGYDALRGMGYTLVPNDWPIGYGAVTAIVRTPTGWQGAADPRSGGGAMGD